MVFCHGCSTTKPREEFQKTIRRGCKACNAKKDEKRNGSWRGALQRLIRSATITTERRNKHIAKKNPDAPKQKVELTYKELVGILKNQGGMCAYSRVALSPKKGDWKISLERKDVKDGYNATNVFLICQRFNSTDMTVREDGEVEGSGGWSRKKFLQYAKLVS